LFPVEQQHELATHIPGSLSGTDAIVLESPYGHDGFLIEADRVGGALRDLLSTPAPYPHQHRLGLRATGRPGPPGWEGLPPHATR
jgi:hypothetical protein